MIPAIGPRGNPEVQECVCWFFFEEHEATKSMINFIELQHYNHRCAKCGRTPKIIVWFWVKNNSYTTTSSNTLLVNPHYLITWIMQYNHQSYLGCQWSRVFADQNPRPNQFCYCIIDQAFLLPKCRPFFFTSSIPNIPYSISARFFPFLSRHVETFAVEGSSKVQ